MKPTATAEATVRPPARDRRTAARRRRLPARLAAAAVGAVLLLGGCAAAGTVQTPVAAEGSELRAAGPGASRPAAAGPQALPAAPPTPAAVPKPAVPVRPASPLSQPAPDPAPSFLSVDGTTINLPVVQVGVSPDGAMEIPEPFDEAGWYRFGPAPGAAAGTAVLAAHVDTTSENAPFSQLKTVVPGTLVQVQRVGAPALTYRVTGVELMAKDAFDGASVFRRDGPPQLKLVTCGGRWLDEQQDYGDNVIVTAVPA
ncbi:class F sortase [Arthrobacter sp. MP_M7]|uniref:class F sortase n=1 Tax=Arthrobacter sp. MP_M7 TaxID=3071716 RepID=UPI002DF90821|nr:hypothetical protein [Arthrobacter sp. MP_M4]MEC5202759.1 hypothetical protein [Arthrobacter sp. MP_M7]